MADNSGIIKVGLFGAALYLAWQQGWLSFLGIGTAAATTTTGSTDTTAATAAAAAAAATAKAAADAATAAATSKPNPKANVLDGIYTAMVKAANAPSAGLGVDAWGYYLNQQLAPLGLQAPDPQPIFASLIDGLNQLNHTNLVWDRSALVTASTYWTQMAPQLRSQLGLSGLGLYGGLGALMRRYA